MKHRPKGSRSGFTLVELLVVIGIITILVGLLVAGVGTARKAANTASSRAFIAQLTAAIESYHGDQKAYPGPIGNDDVWESTFIRNATHPSAPVLTSTLPAGFSGNFFDSGRITMSENLVLGLLGGLIRTTTDGITYDPSLVGKGGRTLSVSNPKALKAYIEVPENALTWQQFSGLKTGKYADELTGTSSLAQFNLVTDTGIPEFTDRYPDPLPVLYFRSRVGADGVVTSVPNSAAQYDVRQNLAYTQTYASMPGGAGGIGAGKNFNAAEYVPAIGAAKSRHGLQAASDAPTQYPYDAVTAFLDPTVTPAAIVNASKPRTAAQLGLAQSRRKDSYILIGAGPDRLYGTNDDITNFGSYK